MCWAATAAWCPLAADRQRPGDGDPSRDEALFHDHANRTAGVQAGAMAKGAGSLFGRRRAVKMVDLARDMIAVGPGPDRDTNKFAASAREKLLKNC